MKIGAAVGCLTYPHYQPPYENVVRRIGELGFDGVELIAYTAEDLKTYYTRQRINSLKSIMNNEGLELTEFILYAHAVSGLSAEDKRQRAEALAFFQRGLEVAQELGTGIVNTVSNWPDEMHAPIPYVPLNFHPFQPGYDRFEPKHHFDLPPNFDASSQWERYLEALAAAVELCAAQKMRFALEGHANVIAGTTDAMLRAFDRIPSPWFGTNFDVAWQYMQREYPPMSVYKLRERIFHVHLRDTDGMICYSYPIGQGVIDWNLFVRALKEVGYNGVLSLELAGLNRPEKYLKESMEYMRRVLREENADH